ncbi:MAG: adenosylcobinamide-phosphate synthase CbiB [Leucothrix sp.]
MLFLLTLPLSLLLDHLLGEPKRYHPLITYGKLVDQIEAVLNRGPEKISKGAIAWIVAVLPITLLVWLLDTLIGGWWLSILCGWLAVGWHSLRQHGTWVEQALLSNNLDEARQKIGWLVSRDTTQLNPNDISKAGIESILENGSDAIFAPLFWLAVGGAPAVVAYRLCNTLDAMWGYRNQRYEQFGKFSARVDDLLNIIPARLTAITYGLVGHFKGAMQAWRAQMGQWYSPNAGVVMAAGAGALNLSLGGNAVYDGQKKHRPKLGLGQAPTVNDLSNAIALVNRSVYLWGISALVIGLLSLI